MRMSTNWGSKVSPMLTALLFAWLQVGCSPSQVGEVPSSTQQISEDEPLAGLSPGKRAERPTASLAFCVARDSKGMGPGSPEPSGESVSCLSSMHCTGKAVVEAASASGSGASRCRPVQWIGGMLNKTGITFAINWPVRSVRTGPTKGAWPKDLVKRIMERSHG
jgi:hypothetical protein